ncbi:MAG: bifunctional folylpolyglutamate synthase/dihydrofolate synthase [Lachnospiraceae bacterium]|nr:bifunctional folylpolyglutamate synthase/dihydrofolate synthase [Lachnospiraceae bacterium]
MKYEDVMEYMECKVNKLGSVPGLDSIRELLNRMGNPQDALTFIHVAGTNGKGSVSTLIANALSANGYKVGRYISPIISEYRERIQINNRMISKNAVTEGLSDIYDICTAMEADGLSHPTAFEIETALGFQYFKNKKCDYVVLETGMGGTLDATNIVKNTKLCVFTSVSMDHMAVLGDTLTEIASNKAGILKSGCKAVSGLQCEEVLKILKEAAEALNVPFTAVEKGDMKCGRQSLKGQKISYKGYKQVDVPLLGSFQAENAALALEALIVLQKDGLKLKEDKIRKGFMDSEWPARFEILSKKPYVIADGAHNEDAVKKLMETVRFYFTNQRIIYIMGVLKDKDYTPMIQESVALAEYIFTVTSPNKERALPAFELAKIIREYNPNVTASDSVEEALEMARLMAGDDGVVLAFGSLSYMGKLRACFERERK